MATLTETDLALIKRELLDHVIDLGAEPYIAWRPIYAVIQANVLSSTTPATTSSTAVTSAMLTAGGIEITVGSVTGLSAGLLVQVDVGSNRETVPIRSVSGSVVGVNLTKTHAGTYPVELSSGLTIVRGLLSDLSDIHRELNETRSAAGIKKVDEVEFFGASDGRTALDETRLEQWRLRRELARAIGLEKVLQAANAGGRVEQY